MKGLSTMMSALALAAIAGLAATASAQPLGGPAVKQPGPAGSAPFGSGAPEGKGRPERPLPMPVFMRAIHEALGPDAPESLRLTDEQANAIRAAADAQRDAVKAYVQEHKAEIEELAKNARGPEGDRVRELLRGGGPGERGPGGRDKGEHGPGGRRGPRGHGGPDAPPPPPEGGDEMAPPPPPPPGGEEGGDRAEFRAKAKALMEGAPKPTDTQKQIWSLLKTEQQDAVQAELESLRSRGPGGDRFGNEGGPRGKKKGDGEGEEPPHHGKGKGRGKGG